MGSLNRFLIGTLLLLFSHSASGQLNLQNGEYTGEVARHIFNERFSYDEAQRRLVQINRFLDSFRALTEQYRDRFTTEELRSVGNTGGEMQGLGFYNVPKTVEGTLRKQQYQLKQLEYELAERKYAAGEITVGELGNSRSAYEDAEEEFQTFWDSFVISD